MWRLAMIALIAACTKGPKPLDNFDHAMKFARLDCHGEFEGSHWRCEPIIRDTRPSASDSSVVGCPCQASMDFTRGDNGALTAVSLQMLHCPHAPAANAYMHLERWRHSDDLADIMDRPAGAQQELGVQHVVRTEIRGDRVLELEWSRESYLLPDGTVQQAQDSETYRVGIRMRRPGDQESLRVEREPQIVPKPRCPFD